MIESRDFPRLTAENHQITSPHDVRYNCIAWAVEETDRWWEPGVYWPVDVQRNDYGIAVLEQAYNALGFEECADGTLEPGFTKVALYGNNLVYTHAARQLIDGRWTSKLGKCEDITHTSPEDIGGGIYGEVVEFMKRPTTR